MWLETAQGIVTLAFTGVSLISAIVGLSVKLFKTVKEIIKNKNWLKVAVIADRAMEAAEKTGATGANKKAQVIEATKAGCLEIGIDAIEFLDQLSTYIDDCIKFANSMKDAMIQGKIKAKASK